MKQLIIGISLITAIAFLVLSVITTYEIFSKLISTEESVRGELWALLIVCFTGGVIMLSIAWGIAELTDSRRVQREIALSGAGSSEEWSDEQ